MNLNTLAVCCLMAVSTLTSSAFSAEDCRAVLDKGKRLECYDSLTGTKGPNNPPPRDQTFLAIGKAAVKKLLRDPASARFENLKVANVEGEQALCGLVNAKNAAGGMTGPQDFVTNGKITSILVLHDDANNPTSMGSDILALVFRRGYESYEKFCKPK